MVVALAPSLCQENPRMLTGISLLLAVAGPLAPYLSGPPGTVPDNRGSASTSAASALDVIVSDMALMNDAELAGVPKTYGWAKGPGHVFMGNVARGTNTPTWWQVDNPTYKSSAWWTAVLPWFVIFDGVGHKANNTRVEVRDLRIYTQSRTSGSWKLLNHSVGVDGKNFPKSLQGEGVAAPDMRTEASGATSIRPPGDGMVFHGWSLGLSDIDGPDIAAVFITIQARLAKGDPDGPDDRALAKYLIHVGGDYYPERSTRVSDFAPSFYFPGIGVSRAKLVTNDWQAFNFATIDVGVQDPGGSISEADFRSNPPPLPPQ